MRKLTPQIELSYNICKQLATLPGVFYKYTITKVGPHVLSSTNTDTCIGIGRIWIRGYGNFPNNSIRGYVLTIFNK